MIRQLKRLIIITGHYGSGKTTIAASFALHLAAQEPVTLVDLDIVNPYFRSADLRSPLESAGIQVIAPVYANTNLDSPVLPPEISGIFRPDSGRAILDVGGDDAGAVALGQYAPRLEQTGYDLCYVINSRRYLTRSPSAAAELLADIQAVSRLKATCLINNTNLGPDTSPELIRDSLAYGDEVSARTGLPVLCTCFPRELSGCGAIPNGFPIDLLIRQPWERGADSGRD